MKRIAQFAIAFSLAIHCSFCHAAAFTSTTTLNQDYMSNFRPTTNLSDTLQNINSGRTYTTRISSGVNNASFMADTDADNGRITDIQFKPISLSGPTTFTRSLDVERLVVDVPANFPNPPVTHFETQTFQERILFGASTAVTPALVSSTTNPLFPILYVSPWFQMTNELTLAPISFVLQGTYEAIGPTSTKSFPFSVTYDAVGGLSPVQRTGIEGGANFGDGFQALPSRSMNLTFRTLTPAVIDEEVDGMRFRMNMPETAVLPLLRGLPIPEPASSTLLAIAALALAIKPRVRNSNSASLR